MLKVVPSDNRGANLATYNNPNLPITPEIVDVIASFLGIFIDVYGCVLSSQLTLKLRGIIVDSWQCSRHTVRRINTPDIC